MTNLDLRLAHCVSATCLVPAPELQITTLVTYQAPGACYDVMDSTQTPLFSVCDNAGATTSSPVCLPDELCDDDNPAAGAISVPVTAGNYRVAQTSAPANHTFPPGEQICKASAKACPLTFSNSPNNNPWFPWDVTGDGFVSGLDFFALLQRFGQGKP